MNFLYETLGVPFGLLLRLIYESIGFQNYAVSIILLTFISRLIMTPSSISQQKGMAKTQRLQPKLRRIQTKFAGDQRRIQEETTALYQREGYNPMNAGCAPMLVQFLLLFGLIGAIYYPLSNFLRIDSAQIELLTQAVAKLDLGSTTNTSHLAELLVIQHIDSLQGIAGVSQATYDTIKAIDFNFFGLFSLGDVPSNYKDFGTYGAKAVAVWMIPVLSFLSSLASGIYTQMKQKKTNPTMSNNPAMGCMTFGMPIFSLLIVINYPVGIGIYWIASSIFGLLSTIVIGHFYSPKKTIAKIMVDETVERRSRENNLKLVAADKTESNS